MMDILSSHALICYDFTLIYIMASFELFPNFKMELFICSIQLHVRTNRVNDTKQT